MARRKQLKVNGHEIEGVRTQVVAEKDTTTGLDIRVLRLDIESGGDTYSYEIREHGVDIHAVLDHVKKSLERARRDFLNVEIKEDKSSNRLTFNVQKTGLEIYRGWRA